MSKKVVLAYSGGLDTSAIIPWLRERSGYEVIAVAGDIGQGAHELEGIEKKAIDSGAKDCFVVELKRRFVEEFVYPTLICGAVYEGRYLLGTSIARPLLAEMMVDVARETGADALAHGCTGKGNDQVRFESAFAVLAPDLEVIAPWREWSMRSREELLDYLSERSIPCAASARKIYSRDANLLHVSHEGGVLEDPWNPPPDDVWTLTTDPREASNTPEDVLVGFERGRPVSIDGLSMPGERLLAALNERAARHGVGRVDLVENRLVGIKSRGCYETPGGTVLHEALRALEEIVLDRPTRHARELLGLRFAEVLYDGQWFTPLREALWASAESMAAPLTGEVVVRLHKGSVLPTQRRSPNSLYDEAFATFGADDVYDHADASGFIRLFTLPSRISAMRNRITDEVLQP